MDLCRKFKPDNYEDFFKKYVDYANKHMDEPIIRRGLNIDGLFNMANQWRDESVKNGCDSNIDVGTFLYAGICHIIVETYDGWLRETALKTYLEGLGFKCFYPENRLDRIYGVDMLISVENEDKWFALQVKPISFVATTREDTIKDEVGLCMKHDKLKRDRSIDTYYVIYDNQKWLRRKDNGKYLFKVGELFDYSSDNIEATFRQKFTRDDLEKSTELTMFNT